MSGPIEIHWTEDDGQRVSIRFQGEEVYALNEWDFGEEALFNTTYAVAALAKALGIEVING